MIELKDRPVFDVRIGFTWPKQQSISKQWSDNKPLTSEITKIELKPGESKTIEVQAIVPSGRPNIGVSATFYDTADPSWLDNPISTYMSLSDCHMERVEGTDRPFLSLASLTEKQYGFILHRKVNTPRFDQRGVLTFLCVSVYFCG